MRVRSEVTSLSWIPSEAVSGPMRAGFAIGVAHYDEPPPPVLGDLAAMREADAFRFANQLAAWAEFDGERLVDCGYEGASLMGSTTSRLGPLGITLAAVGLPDLLGEPETGPGLVRFRQTCGGRTAFPLPRAVPHPPYLRVQAPLVWTTLTLTLYATGQADFDLVGASPFPRHWVYGPDGALAVKAGRTDYKGWTGQASTRHTPWGDEDSPVLVTAAESATERQLSTAIMRAGRKPEVRRRPAGAVLTEQGAAGDEIYLLLDGVVAVEVDGRRLAEVGPGAVFGERAVLEGGRRTATVVATTPVRVAVAAADAVDREALATLAAQHRREDAPA
jgi:Cyclic nucleotide-binding domain